MNNICLKNTKNRIQYNRILKKQSSSILSYKTIIKVLLSWIFFLLFIYLFFYTVTADQAGERVTEKRVSPWQIDLNHLGAPQTLTPVSSGDILFERLPLNISFQTVKTSNQSEGCSVGVAINAAADRLWGGSSTGDSTDHSLLAFLMKSSEQTQTHMRFAVWCDGVQISLPQFQQLIHLLLSIF